MSFDAQTLYRLLPAIHRARDAEQGGKLLALIGVLAREIAVLEEDLAQLYDNLFIETCDDWVAPYIGDLIGYRQLRGSGALSAPRAEVADTLRLRRGKGTAGTLEILARDVSGWDTHVIEQYRRLALTRNLNHPRADRGGTLSVRKAEPLERFGGPFEQAARGPDARTPALRGAAPNIANVSLFFWRLRARALTSSPAFEVDATRYTFEPRGAPVALFSSPIPDDPALVEADPRAVARPLQRRGLDADLADYYGPDKSFALDGVAVDSIVVADLSDSGGGWAHVPPAGKIAVDPVLGRIAYAAAPAAAPKVSFHYGAALDIGGGSYDRLTDFLGVTPLVAVPSAQPAMQAGLNAAAAGGAVEIGDNGRYAETPSLKIAKSGATVQLRAGDKLRPLLALGGEMVVSGADGASLLIDGLLIDGARLHAPATADNKMASLTLRHCTLTPGLSLNAHGAGSQPGAPSLVIEAGMSVTIDSCIVGPILAAPGARVSIVNSIVDAGGPSGVAYAAPDGASSGAPLTVTDSTIIGKVRALELVEAANTIFAAKCAAGDTWPAPVWIDRRQIGEARFCYLPPGSRTPRARRCVPAAGDDAGVNAPIFASARYGDPGYGQLDRRTALSIRTGAEDGAEIGVARSLQQPLREANLRARLDEFLRLGLDAGFVFVT